MEIAFKIRKDILTNINYIKLTTSIMPIDSGFGTFSPLVRQTIVESERFLNTALQNDLMTRGIELLNAQEILIKGLKKVFPPKVQLEDISVAYCLLTEKEDSLFSYGIPYSWLDKYIDTSNTIDPCIPYHVRVGIGYHACKFSVQEGTFLDDAFYFLVVAEQELNALLGYSNGLKPNADGYHDEQEYNLARNLNLNACSFARNSIINFYSFFECFVNSIGFDYLLRNESSLGPSDIELLKGLSNGKYISLEQKVEKYHQIMSEARKQIIFIKDKHQLKDPFLTLFAEHKDLRDSTMHHSPLKARIWKKPTDWIADARKHSKIVVQAAREFWCACYSDKEFPFYLNELNYTTCYECAMERLKENGKLKQSN